MQYRDYQLDMSDRLDRAWASGSRNLCAVLPTGAGKTVIFGKKLKEEPGVSFAIAHRQELIFQISMALAKVGVEHNIIAPPNIVRWAVKMHLANFGRHFHSTRAHCFLSGVLTLKNRASSLSNALNQTKLWVIDEFQHVLRENVWGKAVGLFPETAKGLGVTATPERADGKGLGRHADGVCDRLIVGPGMRELIIRGYLSDYRIFAPRTHIDLSNVPIGSTGDYSQPKLIASVRKSQIVGDVVDHYLRIAPGKIGVTFVPDVQTGEEISTKFNAAGVPSAMVHAKTPHGERQEATAALARGDLKEIVNVDIFGEGFDLPAIEVCSFARPTESYGLYVQQFGRDLRLLEGKSHGIIIDHVGNVQRHGLPDRPREWTLDARERRSGKKTPGLKQTRVCINCTALYEAFEDACPICGFAYAPEGRDTIEQVEGDLTELTPEALAELRGEIERIDAPAEAVGELLSRGHYPGHIIGGAMKQHRRRQEAQAELREQIARWAGYQRVAGIPDNHSYRRFYGYFGIDVMGAQVLGRPAAEALTERIKCMLN